MPIRALRGFFYSDNSLYLSSENKLPIIASTMIGEKKSLNTEMYSCN